MNRYFWSLRILALAILFVGGAISSSPGIGGSLDFCATFCLGMVGLFVLPLICFYAARAINSAGILPLKFQSVHTPSTATAILGLLAAVLTFFLPQLILLLPLWPIPAFIVFIHWLLTSPRFESPTTARRPRVLIEALVFILVCALSTTLVSTSYLGMLRFRLNARAFNAALSTSLTMPASSPAHPVPTPVSIGTFTIYDIRNDSLAGTYFLTRSSGFIAEVKYHGFAYKPNLKASPFYNNEPDHTYTLAPTGVPDWYIFSERCGD
jgi:hypothetical protein